MSGTGKSTLIRRFAALGYKAVDTDDDDLSERVTMPHDLDVGDAPPEHEWLWREDRIEQLLATEDAEVLFVSGCVRNQVKFYPQFDHIVLLSAPADVTVRRLAGRANNPYGKHPGQVAEVLRLKETVEPMLRRAASLEVDATAPLDDVVGAILTVLRTG